MNVMQAAGLCMACALGTMVIRRMRPEMGMASALAGGAVVLVLALPHLQHMAQGLLHLGEMGGLSNGMMAQVMKVTGVSLLMDFAAQTCRDAGENGLAVKAELAGRCMLLTLAIPPLNTMLAQVMRLTA